VPLVAIYACLLPFFLLNLAVRLFLPPTFLDSLAAIAIACSLEVTLFPELDFSFPAFHSRITLANLPRLEGAELICLPVWARLITFTPFSLSSSLLLA
jgi:hypothetical protein